MKTIKIFLASSGELSEERKEFVHVLNSIGKYYKNLKLESVKWETDIPSGSYQKKVIQKEINPLLTESDIVILLVYSNLGKFTLEEYKLANTKKKKIFIYFKTGFSPKNTEEITTYGKVLEFKEKIERENKLLFEEFINIDQFQNIVTKDLNLYLPQIVKAPAKKTKKSVRKSSQKPLEIPEIYKDWINDHCQYMGVDRLREKGNVIQVRLPEIFIPLYAYPPEDKDTGKGSGLLGKKKAKDITSLVRMGHEAGEKEASVDIETLAGESEYLLIEGQPGSGKTTLLKHISYCLVQNMDIKGLGGFLPVLIFIKDLKDFFESNKKVKSRAATAEAMLSFYFDETENGLDIETVTAFCNAQKAIILLDGLDEISSEYRNVIVESFADFKNSHKGNKVVLSGRPHGMDGSVVDRFGDRHVKIQTLNMEQVQEFIRKWFDYIYHQGSKIGERTADGMISEIKIHSGIGSLIDNPLMLTAICILYHDGKELPGQRAELYKKFIENLLYKRFDDPEKVYGFLKTLAFKMHSEEVRSVDRSFAVDTLKSVYVNEGMEDKEYTKWTEDQFDLIEPNCGLLRFDDGQYTFWHLTFQEFLTAVYIVDNSTDYERAIHKYWSSRWYNEVIELFISFLSIENRKWANQIVEKILEAKDKVPFYKWLLASKSLVDMHKNRRDPKVLEKSKNILLEIIGEKPQPEILMEAGETLGWLGDTRDLKEFIKISGGEYTLSTGKATIKPFEIGKFPVTNGWFEEFVKEGGYKKREYWSEEGKKWLDHNNAEHPRYWNDRKWKCPNSPVVGITWYEAYAFTKWLTGKDNEGYKYRLPDEKEWEAVAAGNDQREYPWGSGWDKNKCNAVETEIGRTSPVGTFKDGKTPESVFDLSGNVWEWTTSDYHSKIFLEDFTFDEEMQKLWELCNKHRKKSDIDKYISNLKEKDRALPVLRGGSWYRNSDWCRCAYRGNYGPVVRRFNIGFRCARTLTL